MVNVKYEKNVGSGGGGPRSLPSRTGSTPAAPSLSANIKVAVRVRPANEREQAANSRIVVDCVDKRMLVFDPKEEMQPFFYQGVQQQNRNFLKRANKELKFMFDNVFGTESSNQDVFKATTKDILSALMDGFNCSVFVYGATGAGKTFTMIGSKDEPGITYLTMDHLFATIESYHSEREFEIHVSYLEVYNENVFDLLKPSKKALQLREDSKFGVMVAGLTLSSIRTARQLLDMLEHGNRNRTQHPTDANAESSRSHAVFQVYVKMRYKTSGEVRIVKLSMIDLAGSERASATGCVGERFKEGANINRSLLSLGNCINKLADGCKYIPYRDSKLTRLLKDSLGGNCQTIMIANISPSSLCYDDSYNTLKYAARANKIQMSIKKNIVECDLHVSQYVKIIEELRNQVKEMKAKMTTPAVEVKREVEPAVDKTKMVRWRHRLEEEYRSCAVQETRLLSVMSSQRVLVLRQHSKKRLLQNMVHLATHNAENLQIMEQINQEEIPRQERRMDNFSRQIKTLQTKWHSLWSKWNESKTKMSKLFSEALSDCPELSDFVDKLKLSSEQKFTRARYDHQRKVMSIQAEENHSMAGHLAVMPNMMRKLFLILKGYGKITPAMTQEYMDIMRKAKNSRAVSWEDEQETDLEESDSLFKFTSDLDLEKPTELPITLLTDIMDETEPRSPPSELVSDSDIQTDGDHSLRKRKATPNGKLLQSNDTIIIEDSFTDFNSTKIITPSPAKKAMLSEFTCDNIAIGIENFNKQIDPKDLNSTFVLAGKLEANGKLLAKSVTAKKGLSDMTNTHRNVNLVDRAKVVKPIVGRALPFRRPGVTPPASAPAGPRTATAFGSTLTRPSSVQKNMQEGNMKIARFNSIQKSVGYKAVRARERMQTHPYTRPAFNKR